MKYFKNKGIECFLIFFDDKSVSKYHDSLYPRYKYYRRKRRVDLAKRISETFYEEFEAIYAENIEVAREIFSHFSHSFFVGLEDLESDFIPYFCMQNIFSDERGMNPKYKHIILSSDKDFRQILDSENVFQITHSECYEPSYLTTSKDALEYFFKFEGRGSLESAKFFPLLLATVGDISDNLRGLSVPRSDLYKYLSGLLDEGVIGEEDYSADRFFEKLRGYAQTPQGSDDMLAQKMLYKEEKIRFNYKLISFSELMQWLPLKEKEALLELFCIHPTQEKINLLKKVCPSSYFWECLF